MTAAQAQASAVGNAAPDITRRHVRPARQWGRLARVVWLEHRGAFVAMWAFSIACAATIVVEGRPARATLATYVADHCVTDPIHVPCGTIANNLANTTDPFSAVLFVLEILPVIVGVFLGAPLVARELESGTYRFAFTQATTRTRVLLTKVVMLGVLVTGDGVVLGLLMARWARPFEVVGAGVSMWNPGTFVASWWLLAAWSLLGLCAGTLIGAVVRKTVPAMATTLVVVGGLVVAIVVVGVKQLLSIAPEVTSSVTPRGLGVGALGFPAYSGEGPRGSWLVRAWMTGPHGRLLGPSQSIRMLALLDAAKTSSVSAPRLLALHHVSYWVRFQPAWRDPIFQGVVGLLVLVLATIAILLTVHRLRHLV